MHETSSDWDAREKVVKSDHNSFFKGHPIPKGWLKPSGECAFTFYLFSSSVTIPISKRLSGVSHSSQIPNIDKTF